MPIIINDLTINFQHLDRETLMGSWRWLIGPTKQIILLTAVGDAFLQDAQDGTIHFLDTIAGDVQLIAESYDDLQTLLSDKEFVVNYFAVELYADLQQQGKSLSAGHLYSYKHPPVLGGQVALDNIEPTDIDVHFTLMGQIHQQIKGAPKGTSIGRVTIR
jgi:hypothetical protein